MLRIALTRGFVQPNPIGFRHSWQCVRLFASHPLRLQSQVPQSQPRFANAAAARETTMNKADTAKANPIINANKTAHETLEIDDEEEEAKVAKLSLAQRSKAFFKKYGRVALGTYIVIDTVTLASLYLALNYGVDLVSIIKSSGLVDYLREVGYELKWLEKDSGAHGLVLAYAIYKILLPLRLALAVPLTRAVVRRFPNLLQKKVSTAKLE